MTDKEFEEYIEHEKKFYCTEQVSFNGLPKIWDAVCRDNSVAIYPIVTGVSGRNIVANVEPWTVEEPKDLDWFPKTWLGCNVWGFFIMWQCKG